MVYEPQEDSFLLKESVRKYAKGVVIDVGTGSGLQAREAVHSKRTKKVFAVDIDPEAIAYAQKHSNGQRHKLIKWIVSDLFSAFKGKKYLHSFDTIIFNPPYLPQDHHVRDIALEGGRQGHEVIERFLKSAGKFLAKDGVILLVFSSLTPHMKECIARNMFVGEELGKSHFFFEDILVYLLKRHPALDALERKGVCDISFFAQGKRGLVFTGKYKRKKVAIKIKREESTSFGTIPREAQLLKELNLHGIGPKYLFNSNDFLVYEFVEGEYLKDVVSSPSIRKICKKVFEQCFQLDLLHVNKQEMTRPLKHVIVNGSKVTFIDFERARKVEEAHNVTQFCQFVRNNVERKDRTKWVALAREYSKERSKRVLKKIVGCLDE